MKKYSSLLFCFANSSVSFFGVNGFTKLPVITPKVDDLEIGNL
jgi:hypothetical protein